MSDFNGISQCGQYPASLFNSPLNTDGINPSDDRLKSENGRDDDKVTLSSDAITLAKADLKANLQMLKPAEDTNTLYNNIKNRDYDALTFSLNSAPRTSFYTVV